MIKNTVSTTFSLINHFFSCRFVVSSMASRPLVINDQRRDVPTPGDWPTLAAASTSKGKPSHAKVSKPHQPQQSQVQPVRVAPQPQPPPQQTMMQLSPMPHPQPHPMAYLSHPPMPRPSTHPPPTPPPAEQGVRSSIQQKQEIGTLLLPKVQARHGDLAPKITGMLLDLPVSELLYLLKVVLDDGADRAGRTRADA